MLCVSSGTPYVMATGTPADASKWSIARLNTLVQAKKYQQDQALLDSSREKIRTAEMRWKEIEVLCRSGNVNREWKQCRKRWEKLFTDFKKVFDYQKATPSGSDGYFQLSRQEKKDRCLPPKFVEELFQSMVVFVPQNRAVDPHPHQFVDSALEGESRATDTPADVNNEGAANHATREEVPLDLDASLPSDTPSTPTRSTRDPSLQRQGSGSNIDEQNSAEKTTRGWKRTKSERTANELQKITQTFVGAISEDRLSRREEHAQQLSLDEKKHDETMLQQKEAIEASRETGKEIASALAFIGNSIWYLSDGFNRDREL